MTAEDRIKQRMEGRKLADEFLDLLDSAAEGDLSYDADDSEMSAPLPKREGFVRQIAKQLGVEIGGQPLSKMTDAEAKKYEQQLVGFGKHFDETYAETPLEYLEWLQEKQMELSAYLRSDHAQKRKS